MKVKEHYGHPLGNGLPPRLDEVYSHICGTPGIDAPAICKRVITDQWSDEHAANCELTGHELADWLGKWWAGTWNEVCEAVDYLLERGQVTFSDDGEIHAIK